jgi:hypothetical protein
MFLGSKYYHRETRRISYTLIHQKDSRKKIERSVLDDYGKSTINHMFLLSPDSCQSPSGIAPNSLAPSLGKETKPYTLERKPPR